MLLWEQLFFFRRQHIAPNASVFINVFALGTHNAEMTRIYDSSTFCLLKLKSGSAGTSAVIHSSEDTENTSKVDELPCVYPAKYDTVFGTRLQYTVLVRVKLYAPLFLPPPLLFLESQRTLSSSVIRTLIIPSVL